MNLQRWSLKAKGWALCALHRSTTRAWTQVIERKDLRGADALLAIGASAKEVKEIPEQFFSKDPGRQELNLGWLERLLKAGVSPHLRVNAWGLPPRSFVSLAILAKNQPALALLAEHGAEINVEHLRYMYSLFKPVPKDREIVLFLLRILGDVRGQPLLDGCPVDEPIVEALVAAGATGALSVAVHVCRNKVDEDLRHWFERMEQWGWHEKIIAYPGEPLLWRLLSGNNESPVAVLWEMLGKHGHQCMEKTIPKNYGKAFALRCGEATKIGHMPSHRNALQAWAHAKRGTQFLAWGQCLLSHAVKTGMAVDVMDLEKRLDGIAGRVWLMGLKEEGRAERQALLDTALAMVRAAGKSQAWESQWAAGVPTTKRRL